VSKQLPSLWLPKLGYGALSHIILHWTGGTNSVSALDKLHYHFIIDGAGVVHRGLFSVASNARPFQRRSGYAAHALNFNAGSIGIALCGMGGDDVRESPFRAGQYPINPLQWHIAAQCAAQCADAYDIPATTYTGIMQHGEIQARTGVVQRGKWDICKLPWQPEWDAETVQRAFRLLVQLELQTYPGKSRVPVSNEV
jgi:N-acetyl-anhydromuramyl-L-alanine amidase AmpD